MPAWPCAGCNAALKFAALGAGPSGPAATGSIPASFIILPRIPAMTILRIPAERFSQLPRASPPTAGPRLLGRVGRGAEAPEAHGARKQPSWRRVRCAGEALCGFPGRCTVGSGRRLGGAKGLDQRKTLLCVGPAGSIPASGFFFFSPCLGTSCLGPTQPMHCDQRKGRRLAWRMQALKTNDAQKTVVDPVPPAAVVPQPSATVQRLGRAAGESPAHDAASAADAGGPGMCRGCRSWRMGPPRRDSRLDRAA